MGEAADQAQVFAAGEVPVDGGVLAGEPDTAANSVGVPDDVMAQDPGPSGIGADNGGQHSHGGGLTGAVGPEQAQYRAGRHAKIDSVEGHHLAVAFGEALNDDGGIIHDCNPSSRVGPRRARCVNIDRLHFSWIQP